MRQVDSEPVRLDPEVVFDPGRFKEVPIIGTEPVVVVPGQDGELAPADAIVNERTQARTGHRVVSALARGEPEVAEVADYEEAIPDAKAVDEPGQAKPPLGPVVPEVDVAEEVIRHGTPPRDGAPALGSEW
jgi:hypothetical protein